MELLPIIYWSLVGFGIMTLLILITFYISYHIRKKMGRLNTVKNNVDRNNFTVAENKINQIPSRVEHHPKVIRQVNMKVNSNDPMSMSAKRNERITILNENLKDNNSSQ